MIRVIPDIPKIKAHWERRSSEVPDYLTVPMSDGRVIRYNPEIQQPGFVKAVDTVRRWTIGYPLKEKK